MKRSWESYAGEAWPVLVDWAKSREVHIYKDLGARIGLHPRVVKYPLGSIQDYCLKSNLLPLTSIVIGKTTGQPGAGFIGWDIDDLDTAHRMVFSFDWDSVKNPYAGFKSSDSVETIADNLFKNPNGAADVYRLVRTRGVGQRVFRSLLMRTYRRQCAMCGLSFEDALESAHIVPWCDASEDERLHPQNGILLCSLHHRLFDAGLITVSESFKIVYYDAGMEDTPYSDFDKAASVALHGREIRLPDEERHWPSKKLLAKHHKSTEWGRLP